MRPCAPSLAGRVVWAGIALIVMLQTGCATPSKPEPPTRLPSLLADAHFAAPSVRVEPSEVLAISDEMRRFIANEIEPLARRKGPVEALVEVLQHRSGLLLDYESDHTRTAAEAFEARRGNCLSLAAMTAAFARELGLRHQFQALVGEETWTRHGTLTVASGHVNLTVGRSLIDRTVQWFDGAHDVRLSFGNPPEGRSTALRPIEAHTIVAMYMNNRAVESMMRDKLDDAYAYVRQAVLSDPAYTTSLNTLAIVLMRRNLPQHAMRVWHEALQRDPNHLASLQNLAEALEREQRHDEARVLQARLERLEAQAPFKHFDLGRAAVQRGEFAAGRDHLLRELRRDDSNHEFHRWLAAALLGTGDHEGAARHLTLARKHSTSIDTVQLYERKLQALRTCATRSPGTPQLPASGMPGEPLLVPTLNGIEPPCP